MFIRRRRWVVAASLFAVLVVLGLYYVANNHTDQIEGYRVINERTILIEVGGPPSSWTRVTQVTETSSQVRITVESLDLTPGPSLASLKRFEFTVQLAQPLGDRVVVDGESNPVPQPACWTNVCATPSPS